MLRTLCLLACLLGLPSLHAAEEKTYGNVVVDEVVSIYDGDTFRVNIHSWPAVVGERISVRVYGIDTPEMRDADPDVKALARKAKQFSVAALRGARKVELRNLRRDKYFRLLADVYVDGRSLGAQLVKAGLAKAYDGGTKSQW